MSAAAQSPARMARIRRILEQRFKASALEVVDESSRHIGHPGARSGAGHFRLRIVAEEFAGRPMLQRHRMIYAALGELMQNEIHALAIEALAPAETVPDLKTTTASSPLQRTS